MEKAEIIMNNTSSATFERFSETREQIHRQMLSAVSHDLKTPLATIIGSLEVYIRMSEKLTPEKKGMLINSALTEAYRLDNFVTNILDMARLEGGLVPVKHEPCDLASLIRDSLTRLGPRKERGTIALHTTGKRVLVTTDPTLLGRATGLLLENAYKHTGKEPIISVEYGIQDKEAFIRIRDNGPGIPKGQEKAIFSKYTRLARSDLQNAGTGLGLAICHSIMHLLSGAIKVQNVDSGGAEFTLSFPA